MFVSGIYPGKSLRTQFFGSGKPWNLFLTGPGKSWKSVRALCLLHVPIYATLQNVIQLSLTLRSYARVGAII